MRPSGAALYETDSEPMTSWNQSTGARKQRANNPRRNNAFKVLQRCKNATCRLLRTHPFGFLKCKKLSSADEALLAIDVTKKTIKNQTFAKKVVACASEMPRSCGTDSCHRETSNSKVNIIKRQQKAQQCCVIIKKTDCKKKGKKSSVKFEMSNCVPKTARDSRQNTRVPDFQQEKKLDIHQREKYKRSQ